MSEQLVTNKYGALILAAGYSSRMGAFKPLLPIGNKCALEHIVETLKDIGIQNIVIVTGYNRERLQPYIKKFNLIEAYNKNFDEGMFTSIQRGTKEFLKEKLNCEGYFLMPVDCPIFRKDVLKSLMAEEEEEFTVPCYYGKKGHPLYIPQKYFAEIIASNTQNGLKGIVNNHEENLKRVETHTESVILDMDTPKGYKEVEAYYNSGCKETHLEELARGKRFILIRHGQPLQHKEKIFLGQSDIPLSELGKTQSQSAGKKLREISLRTEKIYTSNLARAFETAKIVGAKANIKKIIVEKDFSEMALGDWDGKTIREVKNNYPEEFKKRGENLFNFKPDHSWESFYDLQYRVIKKLKSILAKDKSQDVIIVAHSGVIRVIQNNLNGKSVDQQWDRPQNGEIRILQK